MSEFGDVGDTTEVNETPEVSETPENASEIDDEIDSSYQTYLAENKAQAYEHKSAEEKDVDETKEVKGGSYKDIKDDMAKRSETGEQYEVHHTPANSCTDLTESEGPAVKMEKADHRQTASCGSSKEAQEYRAQQKELIDDGRAGEAVQMDIDDIHDKFGDKYDDGISEMKQYYEEMESNGKI